MSLGKMGAHRPKELMEKKNFSLRSHFMRLILKVHASPHCKLYVPVCYNKIKQGKQSGNFLPISGYY